jgi:hypothetical protein
MLTVSALLAAVGLYWLSYVNNGVMAFAAATVFGVGIAYFWPTMLGVTAERFPKGGALLLGLMGSVGNLAIFALLPQMGAIYDSYTVANIPPKLQGEMVRGPDGKEIPIIREEPPSWLPSIVTERIFPAGTKKLNPDAEKLLEGPARTQVDEASAVGARYAFRWVAVLPCVLIVIFGLIAITDRLRGGYRAVHISEGASREPPRA